MKLREPWRRAKFPALGLREEFLEQIRLWNRIEDLPHILTRPTGNHLELDFACTDYRRFGLTRLAESYGGRLIAVSESPGPDFGGYRPATPRVA